MLQPRQPFWCLRLVRCIAILMSLTLVMSIVVVSPSRLVEGQRPAQPSNNKARKVKPAPPEKGRPKLALPNLDEIRAQRENHPLIKPAVVSTVRSKRKPLQKWDGGRVGDPGTTGQRPQTRVQKSNSLSIRSGSEPNTSRFNHGTRRSIPNRRSASVPPPLPDETFIHNFLVNALGSGDHSAEEAYWDDILRSAYHQGQEALMMAAREMGRTIFESAAYYNRHRSNHECVYDLYMTYLMRDPSQPHNNDPYDYGWDFWTDTCDTYGPEAVRAAFDDCDDFSALLNSLTPNGGISSSAGSIATARVNPFNQTGDQIQARDCEWSLPLISLPGRGGLDLGLGLSYSSLIYTRSGPYLYFDEDISHISPGFRLGFGAIQGPAFDPLSADQNAGRKVFMLVTSAGRRVELRQVAATNIYESADSSYLQLTVNVNNTLTLSTTDGTRISYAQYLNDWQAAEIKDRNGNYLTINNDWRGDIQTITDTLGRVFYFNNDDQGNLNSITQYWNGGWHTWANFEWGASLLMDVASLSGVVGTHMNDLVPVLRNVHLRDGSSYEFGYSAVGQVNVIRRYSSGRAAFLHNLRLRQPGQ